MADTKLSALTALTTTPASDDEVYIRDVSEEANAESKKITTANLLGGVTVVKAKGKRIQTNNWNPQKLYAPVPMTFEDTEVTFVPYGNWGNRQPGEMSVWVKALTNSLEGL